MRYCFIPQDPLEADDHLFWAKGFLPGPALRLARPVMDFRGLRRQIFVAKSAISYSGRISISLGPGMGLGQRFAQATASSMSLTFQSQKPATSSRVAAKRPSMTVRAGPSNAIRLPY